MVLSRVVQLLPRPRLLCQSRRQLNIKMVDEKIKSPSVNSSISHGFWNYLKDACSDGQNASASRIVSMVCVPLTILIPLFLWTGISLSEGKMVDFPGSIIGFMAASNTLVLGAQNLNKREETKLNNPNAL